MTDCNAVSAGIFALRNKDWWAWIRTFIFGVVTAVLAVVVMVRLDASAAKKPSLGVAAGGYLMEAFNEVFYRCVQLLIAPRQKQ